jgi:hypothetical protein
VKKRISETLVEKRISETLVEMEDPRALDFLIDFSKKTGDDPTKRIISEALSNQKS